jgi:hypothetical protein
MILTLVSQQLDVLAVSNTLSWGTFLLLLLVMLLVAIASTALLVQLAAPITFGFDTTLLAAVAQFTAEPLPSGRDLVDLRYLHNAPGRSVQRTLLHGVYANPEAVDVVRRHLFRKGWDLDGLDAAALAQRAGNRLTDSPAETDEAEADTTRAIFLDATNAAAFANRAFAELDNDPQDAHEDGSTAISLDPTLAAAYCTRSAATLRLVADPVSAMQDVTTAEVVPRAVDVVRWVVVPRLMPAVW